MFFVPKSICNSSFVGCVFMTKICLNKFFFLNLSYETLKC